MELFRITFIFANLPDREISKSLFSRRGRICCLLLITAMCCVSVIGFILLGLRSLAPHLLLLISLYTLSCVFPRGSLTFEMLRTFPVNIEENTPLVISFYDRQFDLKHEETGAAVHTAYADIRWIVETETLFILFKRNTRFLSALLSEKFGGIIDKTRIEDTGKKDELRDFLKRSCKNAKWDTSWASE